MVQGYSIPQFPQHYTLAHTMCWSLHKVQACQDISGRCFHPAFSCRYAASDPDVVQKLLDSHAFEKFVESINKVAELHGDIPAVSLVEMYVALMRFTDSVHPDKLANVNRVLGACQRGLAGR